MKVDSGGMVEECGNSLGVAVEWDVRWQWKGVARGQVREVVGEGKVERQWKRFVEAILSLSLPDKLAYHNQTASRRPVLCIAPMFGRTCKEVD